MKISFFKRFATKNARSQAIEHLITQSRPDTDFSY